MSKHKNKIFAFVHIEKAAGTTLIHILRRNFFMKYIDVRPFSKESNRIFLDKDLALTLKLNPVLKCIGGHSIKPFAGIDVTRWNINFITVLRDPIKRYVSQYQHWIEKMGEKISFEAFLKCDEVKNFQTKKIAGSEDICHAKKILNERFLLVGIMEEFDEFLILLKNKLKIEKFDPRYKIINVAKAKQTSPKLIERYLKEIIKCNEADMELYRYVKQTLLPSEKTHYGPKFSEDVKKFKSLNMSSAPPIGRMCIDYLLRKVYYEPATGIIRLLHGLPAKGSY